jgi:hypothetical protein
VGQRVANPARREPDQVEIVSLDIDLNDVGALAGEHANAQVLVLDLDQAQAVGGELANPRSPIALGPIHRARHPPHLPGSSATYRRVSLTAGQRTIAG